MKSRISSIHYSSEALKVNLSRQFPGFASVIPNGCGLAAAEKNSGFFRTPFCQDRSKRNTLFEWVQNTADAGFVATLLSQQKWRQLGPVLARANQPGR
jgi:hypothetical protein